MESAKMISQGDLFTATGILLYSLEQVLKMSKNDGKDWFNRVPHLDEMLPLLSKIKYGMSGKKEPEKEKMN